MHKVLQLRSSGQLLGVERVVLELCRYLPELGYEPVIGVPVENNSKEPQFVSAAEEAGYAVKKFPVNGPFDHRVLSRIRQYVKEQDICIVHSHGYREDLYALWCSSLSIPIATNHLWKRTDWRLKLYAMLDAFLLKRFAAVIAVSGPVKQDMQQSGIPEALIEVIPNGIDAAKFQRCDKIELRKQFGFTGDDLVVGTVSSLTGEKGIEFAIKAVALANARTTKLQLLVIGDGPEQDNLSRLVRALELDSHVTFAGRRTDIDCVLATLDIFCLPSLIEGLPMALLEAMAAGKPIVATPVGDVPAAVDKSVGLLVPHSSPSGLADAIIALAENPGLRRTLGRNARDRVEQQFSARAMAQRYASVYDYALTRHNTG